VLSSSKTCVAATARVLVLCLTLRRPPCYAGAGAYCKARAKLPTDFVRDLTTRLGRKISGQAPDPWKWRGHQVRMVDGSLELVPDTKENLAEYPQQRSQKRGTSPTTMRLVLLLCLATGVALDAEQGAYRGKGTGEMSLLTKMLHQLAPDDILLGDRYYCSFPLLALLQQRGVHACFRLKKKRQQDLHQGEKLGEDDYLQTWTRTTRPKEMAKEVWDSLPDSVRVRVLRVPVNQPGFRCREVFIGTTLLDPHRYPKEEIAKLYFYRWNCELDIRSIKQTLGMKMLSCKTPAMVRTELWVHLLGYNLVRCVMAEAAWQKGLLPRQLSFSGAVQTLDAFRGLLSGAEPPSSAVREALLAAVASHRVGNRPGRYEPRELKHRQRKYSELRKSRQERRAELLVETEEGDNGSGGAGGSGKDKKGGGKQRPSGRQR
jgi:hypothetical protein